MISLAQFTVSTWVDTDIHGIRLKLAPYDPVADFVAGDVVRQAEGLTEPQKRALQFEELAVQAIEAWEGIEDACTPENVRLALRHIPGLSTAFVNLFYAKRRAMAEEGNGSSASSSGTSAEAPSTAEAAESGAENAPTASTTRKASKA